VIARLRKRPCCEVDVVHDSPLWGSLDDAETLVRGAVEAAFDTAGIATAPAAEVAVLLADDAAVRRLNGAWRGLDRATNVLSFPAVAPEATAEAPHLGDIALAYETVRGEAEAEGKALAHHVAHLVIHGFLHLIGHGHDTASEAEAMEALEVAALARLGIADPYAGSELAAARPAADAIEGLDEP
jgi:probable rRNA maturation factor